MRSENSRPQRYVHYDCVTFYRGRDDSVFYFSIPAVGDRFSRPRGWRGGNLTSTDFPGYNGSARTIFPRVRLRSTDVFRIQQQSRAFIQHCGPPLSLWLFTATVRPSNQQQLLSAFRALCKRVRVVTACTPEVAYSWS